MLIMILRKEGQKKIDNFYFYFFFLNNAQILMYPNINIHYKKLRFDGL